MNARLGRHVDDILAMARVSFALRHDLGTRGEDYGLSRVRGVAGITAISAGDGHALALNSEGTVHAWGNNEFGQLGDGTQVDRAEATRVRGLSARVVAIAAGAGHSLALTEDGRVLAWGCNQNGQLGDGTTRGSLTPQPVIGLAHGAVGLAARASSFVRLANGRVLAWGFNGNGELGDGTTMDRHSPVVVEGIEGEAVELGPSSARMADGRVYVWGFNGRGQLGTGDTESRSLPIVVGARQADQLATGGAHRLALSRDGSVLGWGWNQYGQLGDGATVIQTLPTPVNGLLPDVTAVAAGNAHSLALHADGTVSAWGWNQSGQLGDGTVESRSRPMPVSMLDHVRAVAAGADFSLALRDDGSVFVVGRQPTRPYSGEPHSGATKLGGQPDLPASVEWPTWRGVPLSFVMQVNLGDVSPMDHDGVLPSEGLLSFFYDSARRASGLTPSDREGWRVLLTHLDDEPTRREFPPELPSTGRYPAIPLQVERRVDIPPVAVVRALLPDMTGDETSAYAQLAAQLTTDGLAHHLLGCEQPIQHSHLQALECALASQGIDVTNGGYPSPLSQFLDDASRHWRLLLQVDSDSDAQMSWSDAGRLYYWIRSDSLAAGDFHAAWMIQESH